MAYLQGVRVADTSTTTGTGNVTVSGTPPTTYRTFGAAFATNDTFHYAIVHRSADEWEVGLGTYNGSNVLVRTAVIFSTNSNNAVSFSAGTKDVFVIPPLAHVAKAADQQTFTGSGTWTKPTGYSAKAYVLIQAWGAGGGGGRSAISGAAAGGGGGGYSERWVLLSAMSATETITIGAGGAAAGSNGNNGSVGGNTTVGSLLTAYGGGGGGQSGSPSGTGNGGQGGMPTRAGATNTGFAGMYPSVAGSPGTQIAIHPWIGGIGCKVVLDGCANLVISSSLAGGEAYYGGGGGGGKGGPSTNFAGGTSVVAGAGASVGAAGTAPAGGGGGNSNAAAGAGAAGQVIITVFDGA